MNLDNNSFNHKKKSLHSEKIYVTQPSMAPLCEFIPYLEEIWKTKILTNSGPFHQQLEEKLSGFLDVRHLSLFSNATIGLMASLRVLNLRGEVITTPFSFAATAQSIIWNGLKPIFVDINPESLNLDPLKIEEAITENTTAILPVHCFGRPCDVEKIQKIADKYSLKVIYDAAHAFDVKCHCGSILNHGNFSVLSFHATKVFNTFEGGAVISPNAEMKKLIDQVKNFGIDGEASVELPGLNGKMSEIHAAYGLLQLKYYPEAFQKRKEIDRIYRESFRLVSGIRCLNENINNQGNYSYFPILVQEGYPISRDELYFKLKNNNILARRYFYPLLSNSHVFEEPSYEDLNYLKVAKQAASEILCLPIYPNLSEDGLNKIISLISE